MKFLLIVLFALGSFSVFASEEGNVCIAVCKYSAAETIVVRGSGNRVGMSDRLARVRKDEIVSYDVESKREAFKKLRKKCSDVSGNLHKVELDQAGNVVKILNSKASKSSSCVKKAITDRVKEESKQKLSKEYTTWWN